MQRVAVVTGGSRGIGRAISIALAATGAKVAANYAGNDEAAHRFRDDTGIPVYRFDVGDYEQSAAGLGKIAEELGPVDIVIANAGITRDFMLHRMKPEAWRDVMRTNLDQMYNIIQPVINGMREREFGRVITIASINAQKGQMGQSNYCASKAGVIGFTKALAQESAKRNITVNCIAPGYVDTEMVAAVPEQALKAIIAQIPVGRLGRAEEIARCVTFLASDDSGFITGATLTVNGGHYIAA